MQARLFLSWYLHDCIVGGAAKGEGDRDAATGREGDSGGGGGDAATGREGHSGRDVSTAGRETLHLQRRHGAEGDSAAGVTSVTAGETGKHKLKVENEHIIKAFPLTSRGWLHMW